MTKGKTQKIHSFDKHNAHFDKHYAHFDNNFTTVFKDTVYWVTIILQVLL